MKKLCLISLFFFNPIIFAQEADTTRLAPLLDSLQSALPDSINIPDSLLAKKSGVDAVVYASSTDSLTFDIKNKKMYLFGKGELKYKKTELKSGNIFVNFETNEMDATGRKDTADTLGKSFIETPVLSEAGEVYEGFNIKYNFETQRGLISLAKNEAEGSRYEGAKVKKVGRDVYFIEDGIYTTCESDTPHTFFSAAEMKVIHKDKVIAQTIFMHVGGVPVPIPLPFAVFPAESGRRSGLIFPTYGQDQARGQYFKNFGYFLAINDFMDFAITGDAYLKGGYGFRGRYRYAKRYDFNGNIGGGFSNLTTGETGDPGRSERKEWNINIFHGQQFDPTTRLDVNLQFLSSSYLSDNSVSYNDLLAKNITSNATLNKRWDESGNSLTLNYSRTQNLESGDINETLPNLNFNMPQKYPFKKKSSGSSSDQSWYELIGYKYSGQFQNQRNKTSGDLKIRGGIKHNISVSASPKIGYFNISPNINYQEKWYNKRIEKTVVTSQATGIDTVIENDKNKINMVRTFDLGLSASTKLYGMFPINGLGIDAVRHTLEPRISYTYQPDFSEDKWGYYDSYIKDGETVRYDKFQEEIFGGVSSGKRQNINFNLSNIFEMKTLKDPTDTTSEAKKIRLLNLGASLSYNLAADSLKLSDLNLSYRTQIGDLLSFSGSSSYTFYDYVGNSKVNKYLASQGKGLFRLTNFSLSLSTSLSGDKVSGESRTGEKKKDDEYGSFEKSDYIALYDEKPPDFSIPWKLSLNYNYRFSKPTPDKGIPSSNLGMNLSMNLTKNWKITFQGNYDIEEKELTAPQVTIYRDLHCWEMNFTWNPLGTYRGFRFEIRLKAPELQDIKITKTKGLYTGR